MRGAQLNLCKAPIRIIAYGLLSEKDAISSVLSKHEVYLQHPSASESDPSVPYQNPHYLLRPGASMPKIGDFYGGSSGNNHRSAQVLREDDKARLLQIFESATVDPDSEFDHQPSPRLKSALKAYEPRFVCSGHMRYLLTSQPVIKEVP